MGLGKIITYTTAIGLGTLAPSLGNDTDERMVCGMVAAPFLMSVARGGYVFVRELIYNDEELRDCRMSLDQIKAPGGPNVTTAFVEGVVEGLKAGACTFTGALTLGSCIQV